MNEDVIRREQESILQTYRRLPIAAESAKGVRIRDKEGREYLDFLGGIGVNVLGHGDAGILRAVGRQTERYMHLSNYFYQDIQVEFAEKLNELTGYSKVFLCNSGTEAAEGALKMLRRWGSGEKKSKIVSFGGAFHGRTYGALSLMNKESYKDKMGPFPGGVSIIDYNDIDALREEIDEETAGVIVEFIQGEGGLRKVGNEWVKELAKLKERYGFMLTADEVQSGLGRTGKFFAYEHFEIEPDVVLIAKGIGGGLPLGCILTRGELENVFGKGMHGSTFGGNALSCAAGLEVLKRVDEELMEKSAETGIYLEEKLLQLKEEYPEKIKEIRGMGLMSGMLLSFEASALVTCLLQRGIITNATSGNVLRLLPPLIIERGDIDELAAGLKSCLSEMG